MAEAKLKKVRVLVQTRHEDELLEHGTVVEMSEDQIKAHAGEVDPHPDAVAYAEKVNAEAEAAKKKKG